MDDKTSENLLGQPIHDPDEDSLNIDSSNGFEMEPPAFGGSLDVTVPTGDDNMSSAAPFHPEEEEEHEVEQSSVPQVDSTIPEEKLIDHFEEKKEPVLVEDPDPEPVPDSSVQIRSTNPFLSFIVSLYHNETVNDVLLWKNIPLTAGVLILFLYTAFSMALMSMLSVIGYYGLGIIICHIALRLYRAILETLGKQHASSYPMTLIDKLSNASWELSRDCAMNAAGKVVDSFNHVSGDLRDIIMVRSYARTLKAALVLYFLTWIGSIFNLLTLVIIVVLNLFYIPLLFAKFDLVNNKEINAAIKQLRDQYTHVVGIVAEKAPFLARFLDIKPKTS